MIFFAFGVVFLLGLVVGSFLNAVIYRLEKGESALKGRSYCPHCKHTLAWYDLIPVVSFALLRGRCRYCGARISWQYPLVEIATGFIFLQILNLELSLFHEFSNLFIFEILYLFIIASFLITLFVYDLKHYILPDKILLPAIGIAAVHAVFVWILQYWSLMQTSEFSFHHFVAPLLNPFAAGVFAAIAFLAIVLFSRGRAMGLGDVKLAAFMGLFLSVPNILVALFSAFVLGGAMGVALLALKKKRMKSEVPFGPFLITGTLFALFWGKLSMQWYIGLVQ